ncbi:hypothetical protein K435DRAFT_838895 [Dendrothele bispora CBS 962.96]|uniref:Uncharacterized protein n=1 Tax=Dendrothele bispora (strain CBS 962.96) TaxID=1314807 RepID=A0A4S8M412_DENBC|nr:hypothetical protein K435DRAFT_838895 [Dendrothele bispora CBS 962.96]
MDSSSLCRCTDHDEDYNRYIERLGTLMDSFMIRLVWPSEDNYRKYGSKLGMYHSRLLLKTFVPVCSTLDKVIGPFPKELLGGIIKAIGGGTMKYPDRFSERDSGSVLVKIPPHLNIPYYEHRIYLLFLGPFLEFEQPHSIYHDLPVPSLRHQDVNLTDDTFTKTACGVGVFGEDYTSLFDNATTDHLSSRGMFINFGPPAVKISANRDFDRYCLPLHSLCLLALHLPQWSTLSGTQSYTELNNLFTIVVYLLSDGIVVWRAYVLYPFNRKIKMLLVMYGLKRFLVGAVLNPQAVAAFVEGAQALKFEARTHDAREGVISFILFVPLLVTNMLATCLVAYKAWEYYKLKSFVTSSDEQIDNKPTVESVLLLIIVTMLSAVNIMGPEGDNILQCILPQIPGIYLMIVILLVAFQKTISSTTVTPANATKPRSTIRFASVPSDVSLGGQSANDVGPPFSVESTPSQISVSFVSRLKDDSDWIFENANDVEKGSA